MATLREELEHEVVGPVRARLGGRLVAVVCYGSAVEHLDADPQPLLGDVDVAFVVDAVDLELTDLLRKVLARRDLDPLDVVLLARAELPRLAELFPAETLGILRRREVLEGPDPFAGLEVPLANLRHQIGYELASHRQALFQELLRSAATEEAVGERLLDMVVAFRTLGAVLLPLVGAPEPASLEDLLAALGEEGDLSARGAEAVRDLQATREDRRRPARGEKREILEAFLEAFDCLLDLAAGPPVEVEEGPDAEVEQPALPFPESGPASADAPDAD